MARGTSSLKRVSASRRTSPVHWVVCEGSTEKRCLDELRQRWRLRGVTVKLVGDVGDPMGVYTTALHKAKELKREHGGRWTVHVVFDRDDHENFDEAVRLCRRAGFSMGVSVPCFELWAILLHHDQGADLSASEAQQLLSKRHRGYDHKHYPYLDVQLVLAGLDDAHRRGSEVVERLRAT